MYFVNLKDVTCCPWPIQVVEVVKKSSSILYEENKSPLVSSIFLYISYGGIFFIELFWFAKNCQWLLANCIAYVVTTSITLLSVQFGTIPSKTLRIQQYKKIRAFLTKLEDNVKFDWILICICVFLCII